MNEQNKSMDEVSYQVMPQSGGHVPPPPVPSYSGPSSSGSGKAAYWVIALIVLVILGGLAYYFLGGSLWSTKEEPVTTSRLPRAWLSEHFGVETCNDQSVCGENADTDKDGYVNYNEFVSGTEPSESDTDGDGLADGDEVNIYHTDPLQKFTDKRDIAVQNNYTDSASIKNGYDPLTPGSKFTDTRLKQIQDSSTQFGRHEPTITTLSAAQTQSVPQNTTTSTQTNTSTGQNTISQPKTLSVNIQNNLMPMVSINVGDTVKWTNMDTTAHTVASNPHPTHTDLPGFVSGSIAKNASYSYTFTKAGTWGYHDHLNPSLKGSVVVK